MSEVNSELGIDQRVVLESSLFIVVDYNYTEKDILFMLLQDSMIRFFLKKNHESKLDICSKDFRFKEFGDLKVYFSKVAPLLMLDLEGEIKFIFNHKNKLRTSRGGPVLNKKAITIILINGLELLKKKRLKKEDFRVIPNAGFIRTHFCRWALLYSFLDPGKNNEALISFRTWLYSWEDPNKKE